jgi:hypothetical protein
MRNYQAEFQQLVNDAINDGWIPMWIDRVEGNDCEIEKGEDASRSVYFFSPDEQKGWDE